MKKTLLSIVAVLAAIVLSVSSFAEPSITKEAAPEVSAIVAEDGTVLETSVVTVTPYAEAVKAEELGIIHVAYDQIIQSESTAAFVESTGLADAVKETGMDLDMSVVHSFFDVSVDEATLEKVRETGSVTITFDISDIKAGDKVVVLHYNGGTWEILPSYVCEGCVMVLFPSFSPIAIIKEMASQETISDETIGEVEEGTEEITTVADDEAVEENSDVEDVAASTDTDITDSSEETEKTEKNSETADSNVLLFVVIGATAVAIAIGIVLATRKKA